MSAAGLASTLIEPDWPVPSRVRALVTTRAGGVSAPPYGSFNLAFHVGDAAERVHRNRRRLLTVAGVDTVQWLDQEHGRRVLAASPRTSAAGPITADAAWTAAGDLGLAVLVADCVPLLLASVDASVVAAVHCGWRGTVLGVVEATVDALPESPKRLVAWLGPGVCGDCYEVGLDVRNALRADEREGVLVQQASACGEAKWRMDLPALVAAHLQRSGVERVVPSSLCTICDSRFYSYRRDGRTGRFAAMIWLAREGRQARV